MPVDNTPSSLQPPPPPEFQSKERSKIWIIIKWTLLSALIVCVGSMFYYTDSLGCLFGPLIFLSSIAFVIYSIEALFGYLEKKAITKHLLNAKSQNVLIVKTGGGSFVLWLRLVRGSIYSVQYSDETGKPISRHCNSAVGDNPKWLD